MRRPQKWFHCGQVLECMSVDGSICHDSDVSCQLVTRTTKWEMVAPIAQSLLKGKFSLSWIVLVELHFLRWFPKQPSKWHNVAHELQLLFCLFRLSEFESQTKSIRRGHSITSARPTWLYMPNSKPIFNQHCTNFLKLPCKSLNTFFLQLQFWNDCSYNLSLNASENGWW